ncbi:heat shock protein HtpX [bacterium BMS3Bbin06]|nr:heat shock protein HtpX [bacterium BMS3Bbin06]
MVIYTQTLFSLPVTGIGEFFDMKIFFFFLFIFVNAFDFVVESLNLAYMRRNGDKVPEILRGEVDVETLRRISAYTEEKARFGVFAGIFNAIVVLSFIYGGLLDVFNSWVVSLKLSFVPSGIVFFLLLTVAGTVVSVPFSLYSTFRIERRFGFNRMTFGLWIKDFVKSLALTLILMTILVSAALFVVEMSPELWWFWVWCLFLAFSIFLMYISPYIIEPLFNKYTTVNDEGLVEGIREMMKKAGINVSQVFRMDASRRTGHTNAYFTGIGRVKRIVLFDTLLDRLGRDEVISVLAHEAGHWKKHHILKMIAVTEAVALLGLYLSHSLMSSDLLTEAFAIHENTFYAKAVLIMFMGSVVLYPLSPLFNYLSRRHEVEADRYAVEITGGAGYLKNALIKLVRDNLSNLYPHPLYAALHYSHPPVLERLKGLQDNELKAAG